MGHKVHPYGYRLGLNKPWLAKWYADRDYATLLQEDMRIRALVDRQLANASVSQTEIERGINHVTVTVHTAKPGIVIGKGGANVELLRTSIGKLTDKKVKLEIKEILQPELDGVLVAQSIAGQLERRIAFRKAVKQGVQRSIKAGAKGVKIQVSGRLGGSEMSRREWDKEGRIPLGTLRADISYGVVHAKTTYGRIGVKVWIYRGDVLADVPGSARTEPREARRPARGRAATARTTTRAAKPRAEEAETAVDAASEPRAPQSEPGHVGGEDGGDGERGSPEGVREEARPHHLIDEGSRPGTEEQGEHEDLEAGQTATGVGRRCGQGDCPPAAGWEVASCGCGRKQ